MSLVEFINNSASEFPVDFASYTPPANLISIIKKRRQGFLPDIITQEVLEGIGIQRTVLARNLQALKWFGFIDNEGRQTEVFQRIAKIPSEDYQEFLSQIIKDRYSHVFSILDPAEATEAQLNDAFRFYSPEGQRSRMVTLFVGLAEHAGIIPEGKIIRGKGQKESATKRVKKPVSRLPTTAQATVVSTPTPRAGNDAGTSANSGSPSLLGSFFTPPFHPKKVDYSLLVGLINRLPEDGKWTTQARLNWINAMTAMIDLHVTCENDSNEN